MTSNLGSEYILNKDPNVDTLLDQELKRTFKPEFLNRIDEIITFKPLDKDTQLKIVSKMLKILQNRLKEEHFNVEFSEKCKEHIIDVSYSFEYGARPIKRFIQREIETLLAKAIISEEIKPNVKYVLDVLGDKFVIRNE